MESAIAKLRECLFQQDINSFIQEAMNILEVMSTNINNLTQDETIIYNEYVKQLGMFLSNSDYLAVADILKYELVPLFGKRR